MEKKEDFVMLPVVDFCFKELMNNPVVRKGFVGALLGIEPELIGETVLLPTILRQQREDEKYGILDVLVKLKDGTKLNMEMQVAYFSHWIERTLFYLSRVFGEQLHKGESYEKLERCVHVSILDFNVFPDVEECYSCFHFNEDRSGRRYSDKMEIQILELSKLAKEVRAQGDIYDWMKFFRGKSRKEFMEMAKKNEYLDEAYQTLMNLSTDEMKRLEYEARQKALRDYNTQMGWARKEGLREGLQEGFRKGRQESIHILIDVLQETGADKATIARKISEKYDLPESEAWKYVEEYKQE